MISDPNDEELYHLSVDLETGESENYELTTNDGEVHDEVVILPGTPDLSAENNTEVSMRQLPPNGMK